MKALNKKTNNPVKLRQLEEGWEVTENGVVKTISESTKKRWFKVVSEEPAAPVIVVEEQQPVEPEEAPQEVYLVREQEVSKPEQKTRVWHMLFSIPVGYELLVVDAMSKNSPIKSPRGTIKTTLTKEGKEISSSYSIRTTLEKVFDNADDIAKTIIKLRKEHFSQSGKS